MSESFHAQLNEHSQSITATLTSTVQKEVQTFGELIKEDVRKQVSDINGKIDKIQGNFNEQMSAAKVSIDKCTQRIDLAEDDVHRMARRIESEIKGVPYAADEDLASVFAAIAQYVGFDLNVPHHVHELKRLQTRNTAINEFVPLPTIIVKFVANTFAISFIPYT